MRKGESDLPVYPVYAGPVAVFVLVGTRALPPFSVIVVYIVTALALRAQDSAARRSEARIGGGGE